MSTAVQTWVKVCALTQLSTDKARGFSVNNQLLVAVRYENEGVAVLQGICSHMWFPLHNSAISDCVLTCSLHQSTFDVRDGSVQQWDGTPLMGEALAVIKRTKTLRSYPTKVEEGVVYLQWSSPNPDHIRVRF